MENSQSSDLFPEMSGNLQHCSNIEIETYTELVSKIKAYECSVEKSLIDPEHFNFILDDCRSCIIQSLEIIVSLLEDSKTLIDQISGYIEDAVCILQILSNFMKIIIESVSITCKTNKNFSTFTGIIILSVFTHCKDSECIYGNNLFVVEKHLKELFRNCHELQLTYLMVLEKHFLFDLTVKDDQFVLEKTLEINLEIGDVVQSLDVKTMAEQWKAYTLICEKYSSFLSETCLFNRMSTLLASTIKTNINTALEADEKDKIVLRSLKVASFSLKILFKLCNIFKCSVHNDYEDIVKLLLNISLCNSSYYELTLKTPEFSALINRHLTIPSDILIDTLADEKKFLNLILLKDISALSDIQLLEHILLLTSTIKVAREKKDLNDIEDVIKSVFSVLPVCHKWFNMGLKLKYTSKDGNTHNCGLYEYLLLNVVAFATTFSSQQYNNMEKYLYEALLGTDYYCSLFASHLWVLLSRLGNDKLQLDTLISLLEVYQKIERHISFNTSPQRVHLSYTIQKLFKSLSNKLQIYRLFNIKEVKNVGVWSVLKVNNLQEDIPQSMDRVIIDNLLTSFNDFSNPSEDSLDNLVKYLRIASKCSIVERDLKLEEFLLRCWLKACPVCHSIQTVSGIDHRYFKYLEGLTSLTECYMEKFEERNLVKILNIISRILLLRINETVNLLFIFFCKLSSFLLEDENVKILTILTNTIKHLIIGDNDYHQYLFNIIVTNDEVNKLIIPVLNEPSLKNVWNFFVDFQNKFNDTEEWQNQLEMASKYRYKHKCLINQKNESIETKNDAILEDTQGEGNFDLGDIDSMFEKSEGKEPASKKAKMCCDVESLIVKLEADVDQLAQVKENLLGLECNVRIKHVCDKLKSLIS